ncbi:MAG: hypothetical protein A3J07_02580 [Candidatus Doudnabacteria bacterium RIFCSPLOWO2_02_FULL_49_13]|uniref:DUF5671 domain-containing protein n=1 Tax=Candidatus Doudnabacteria bacterium RIFCSPHIGHO2_12_FULL_48_16 TaxID=1817838 RepID=A0A1F5PKT6_9BACT|nr:MAG: hypothetical protein A3B77_01230 [Candidatus Doudnabacteria bacterium RIFCSPHIGHO2_02_FULL_49_24]OGE89084.1 MAG: hypothetical protein A2760_02940 [Candidatus Doudnabacteria bacterium RIFCSPHIGHO2_01_FULL_50_67]OGE90565.1 MAG: hypothetical protein A3E29_02095 [Candidatus Doudnabacteria bacterium RIFCSPHIGHO2_12_FULL_48_16]OGE97602.1 MAG: hypothetical protein A2990_03150 [Candidatus Doudnabacteria bacterium RIFCSPLOWO2_01_FULL_49_40]OGF02957.1 MAG: hypothetical protein A3J07_02580 [Candid
MLEQSLINYIKSALAEGRNGSEIRQALLGHGWQAGDVDQALSLLVSHGQSSAPSAPAPALAPVTFGEISSAIPIARTNFISPYSYLLELVLFFALLILGNKAISDIHTHFPTDINGRLIFDALVVIPFLLAATTLHMSFLHSKERFRVLSEPYYLVAGWLIVRLLWNASKYILDKNAVYGVYIVLLLVVAVLTGIVFFIQKYIKKD